MAIHFDVVRDGKHFSVRVDGSKVFPIAAKVRYRNRRTGVERFGLSNDGGFFGNDEARKHLYAATDFDSVFPFWSDFIEPTAICEGQSFISLNTYDRARFTFGFGQFAAHVPDGDFIRWFRDMLQRPEAVDYFPNLDVQAGRIVKVEDTKVVPLENEDSTGPLQLYFNPTLDEVEDAEVVASAKFIHWTTNHPEARLLQVQHMVNTAMRLVKEADRRLGLDGQTGDICCVIVDVRHQGRAGFDELQHALLQSKPYEALLEVGADGEPERVANLKAALSTRRGELKKKKWSRSTGGFV
ncbi:hypothetical protein [Rhizobium ruizarguesonis]|uniref:hypothetical protein n=1 Tax=Rhizobium ruizarguesonis TaxID=2081791 RepID=UPI001030B1D5|nr:hypothetical protein [Rhizobium ruizarguesonis]TAZ68226.1 hypothetical protein ELH68_32540 [Rhizobium ruizarguesonis]TAZ92256.1 hypothetical protein ELH64_25610 [Rhizobium ruizarguesonis]